MTYLSTLDVLRSHGSLLAIGELVLTMSPTSDAFNNVVPLRFLTSGNPIQSR
jgi:hypothetical protein